MLVRTQIAKNYKIWQIIKRYDNTKIISIHILHSYLALCHNLTILVKFIHMGTVSCTSALWQSDLTLSLSHHNVCL